MNQLNYSNMRNPGCNSKNLVQNPTGTWVTFLWPWAKFGGTINLADSHLLILKLAFVFSSFDVIIKEHFNK